jgi:ribosomal protein S12 methylthiotransferase
MKDKKILFVSLGCDKNLVDTEMMLGSLAEAGYSFIDDEAEADIVLVNSCCFIGDAKEESINTLIEMEELRLNGELDALIVTGCLAERYQDEIRKEIPGVDAVLGTTATGNIVACLEDVLNGKQGLYLEDVNKVPFISKNRQVTTGGHFAYIRISEGCDKHCTYCVIPSVRGSFRSIPKKDILEEAKRLVEQGVKELILVGQETTLYGFDLYGKKVLHELLNDLCEIQGLRWIRILYCYPEEIYDELIQTIKVQDKVCNYLDLPIQHASDRILKKMGRRTDQKAIEDIVRKLRTEIPDMCIRTTLISGFPGETEEDHEIVMQFVEDMQFNRLGVFTYSMEEDTPAAKLPDQIDEELKADRRDEIMELQQDIAFEQAEAMIGKRLVVMVEGKVANENAYVTRTYMDAPNVDGYLFLQTDKELMSGDFVYAKVTSSYEYDLIGEIDDEFTK